MKPASSELAEFERIRQQLVLSQVRLMEMEDERENLQTALAERGELLGSTQSRLDAAAEEISRLAETIAAGTARLQELEKRHDAAGTENRQLTAQLASLGRTLDDERSTGARHQQRINQLDAELRAMKTSRSWRWTAFLRAIERVFR